jgi:hypothetical protein
LSSPLSHFPPLSLSLPYLYLGFTTLFFGKFPFSTNGASPYGFDKLSLSLNDENIGIFSSLTSLYLLLICLKPLFTPALFHFLSILASLHRGSRPWLSFILLDEKLDERERQMNALNNLKVEHTIALYTCHQGEEQGLRYAPFIFSLSPQSIVPPNPLPLSLAYPLVGKLKT